jgi:hypothetical protein
VLAQEPERRGGELAAGRAKADRPQSDVAQRAHATREQIRLLGGIEPAPLLVAPAVVGHLMAGGGDRRQRLRIELRVEPLDEERRLQARLLE